ncbi:hypothetical protein Nepgr_016280 [Nepenthes gracilis]|uniref:Uncharacterized protein n=1 Tax=Nepenthes gracilis TaxID=150966 RepID=A0AAD3SPH4_NEPGR|nr:hypothetical protein Nepgr_016280 [Nepenthes gracilis]
MMRIDVVSKDKAGHVLPASLSSSQDDRHANEEFKEGVVVIENSADVIDHGVMDSVVLPLNVVKVGVEHLGSPVMLNQAQIGSSYHGVDVDCQVGDQGSCSIGKLIRNIDKIQKKFDESRARVHEVSYFPRSWQSHLGGSIIEQNQAEVPRVSVSSDPVGFELDTPPPSQLTACHLLLDADDLILNLSLKSQRDVKRNVFLLLYDRDCFCWLLLCVLWDVLY